MKKQRINAMMIAFFLLYSVIMIIVVSDKNKPENVARFDNRFLSFDQMSIEADEDIAYKAEKENLHISWGKSNAEEIKLIINPIFLKKEGTHIVFSMEAKGTQNAHAKERWKFRAWLHIRSFSSKDFHFIDEEKIEMPMESPKLRSRLYAVSVQIESERCLSAEINMVGTILNRYMELAI